MLMRKALKRLIKRGEIGQSLVVLALGFVALLAFVGIVTDVSLMFVRYSTLRRAVDAAAISAAGKMRRERVLDRPDLTGDALLGEEQARNISKVGLAARQFIEFHGLDPKEVWVQTCATDPGDTVLCDPREQRKLVRVTASVDSPTIFLRLLGFPDIELQASALSETAVLDVVLILDVSESMAYETTYEDWADIGRGVVYLPPSATRLALDIYSDANRESELWQNWTANGQPNVNDRLNYVGWPSGPSDANNYNAIALFNVFPGTHQEPENGELCRVRYYPYSVNSRWPADFIDGDNFQEFYETTTGQPWMGPSGDPRFYNGFVPNYNFWGCCNDPDNNLNFDDMICQPFRQVRDASVEFVRQIDFLRGDRVAILTSDRVTFRMDPDGDGTDYTHMIDDEETAVRVLQEYVGVAATDDTTRPDYLQDTGYEWDEAAGGWLGFKADYERVTNNPGAIVHNYPVNGNCPFQDATIFDGWMTNYNTLPPLLYPGMSTPTGDPFYSYELWASCGRTNIGGALREGSNALLDEQTTRSTGTVWVMVLLGDGAAGSSDPAHYARVPADPANPYSRDTGTGQLSPHPGQYGAFGVCPYGELIEDKEFPFCSDVDPASRHFCFDETLIDDQNRYYLDLLNPRYPDCGNPGNANAYDVDDYARDWADFIGLAEEGASVDVQLPTIFTIGFALRYDDCSPTTEAEETQMERDRELPDCLGEELFRYIADVGDNFRVDTDHQEDWIDNHSPDFSPEPDWGVRGPCEDQSIDPRLAVAAGNWRMLVAPLPPATSCGNYFAAPTPEELELVFDEIASRMFTRLAR